MSGETQRAGVDRPLTLVFAALGGEGGGLLTDWITDACTRAGVLIQTTSIPGVAQRTGATTYYIEMMRPVPGRADEPLFGLYPAPGYVDLAVATDLVEAGRLIEKGYVTPERTTLIASTHRVYAMAEKTAMADGAFHSPRIVDAAGALARHALLRDFAAAARAERTAVNALLLGAMSAQPDFPVDLADLEAAVAVRGVAVDANLKGLAAGRRLAEGEPPVAEPETAAATGGTGDFSGFPQGIHDVLAAAVERLADYQDEDYAREYLERLSPLARGAGASAEGLAALRETARYLALWMSYEDVMRVADLKTRAGRRRRIRRETGAPDDAPVRVTEFFKPGVEEFASMLPRVAGERLLAWADRRGGRDRFHVPLHLRSDTVLGHLALRFVAARKRGRRRSARFAEEQAIMTTWLDAVGRALGTSPSAALEIARLGQLVKGYGDTRARAMRNFRAIFARAVEPVPAGQCDGALIARAREAALADEEGRTLARVLDEAAPLPN